MGMESYELQRAAAKGDLAEVERLLQTPQVQADPNTLSGAFNDASGNGHLPVVERLLQTPQVQAYLAPNSDKSHYYSGFSLAIKNGHLPVVERLLQTPQVQADTEALRYGFRMASASGQLPMVELLLRILEVQEDPATLTAAFELAIKSGHLPVVERLLQILEAQADSHPLVAGFRMASASGQLPVVERLLKIPQVLENAQGWSGTNALADASAGGHLAVVDRLLQIRQVLENAHVYNNFVLKKALAGGHVAVVDRLLQIPEVWRNINDEILRDVAENGREAAIIFALCKVYRDQNKQLPADITTQFQGQTLPLTDFLAKYERFLQQQGLDTVKAMSLGKTQLGALSRSRQFPKALREQILLLSGLAKPSGKVDQIINQLIEGTNAYADMCEKSDTKATAEGRLIAFITSLSEIIHQMGDGNRGNVFRDMTTEDKRNLHQAIRVLMEDMGQVIDENAITQEYAKETGAAIQTLRNSLDNFRDCNEHLPNVINDIIETLDKERFFGFPGHSSKPPTTRFHF